MLYCDETIGLTIAHFEMFVVLHVRIRYLFQNQIFKTIICLFRNHRTHRFEREQICHRNYCHGCGHQHYGGDIGVVVRRRRRRRICVRYRLQRFVFNDVHHDGQPSADQQQQLVERFYRHATVVPDDGHHVKRHYVHASRSAVVARPTDAAQQQAFEQSRCGHREATDSRLSGVRRVPFAFRRRVGTPVVTAWLTSTRGQMIILSRPVNITVNFFFSQISLFLL